MTSDDELLSSLMLSSHPDARDAYNRIRELLAQLPEGMEHCTIEFKECEHGHGRLVATNWVDHGCHVCRLRELEAELESRHSTIRNLQQTIEACGACVEWWQRIVDDKTHVIVPVEPTEAMLESALACLHAPTIYRAMIRAAQSDKPQQGE